jgi:hypothetical protein
MTRFREEERFERETTYRILDDTENNRKRLSVLVLVLVLVLVHRCCCCLY